MNNENRPVFDELEPRILLSCSPAPESGDAAVEPDVQSTSIHEVLFIDSEVDNYSELLQNFDRNVEVFVITQDQSGIDFISEVLAERQDIDAIHIFSHGSSGEINLGTQRLNLANITNHANSIQQWSNSLSMDADILVYGCDVGQSVQFLTEFSALTGADVAASDDLTGAQSKGGDADLEIETGFIGVSELFSQQQLNTAEVLLLEPEFSTPTTFSWDPGSQTQPNSTSGTLPEVVDAGGEINLVWQFNGTETFSTESFDAYNSADASFEFYLNADALSADGNYLIFETGGTVHGTTLWIERSGGSNTLKLLVQYNTTNEYFLEADLSSVSGYFNAAFTVDRDATNGEIILYVDGTQEDIETGAVPLSDWAGSDDSSIGGVVSGNSAQNNITGSFSNFSGQIARINFYNKTLSSTEVSTANSNITNHQKAILGPVVSGDVNSSGDTVDNLFAHLFSDADTDTFAGIAVSGDKSGADGTWEYDAGSGWAAITGVSTANALYLDGDAKLRFVPGGSFVGFLGTLEVHAVDNSAGVTFSSLGAGEQKGDISGNDGISSGVTELETYVLKANESPIFGNSSDATYSWDPDNASQPLSTSTTESVVASGFGNLGNAWNLTGAGISAASFPD